MGRAYRTRRRAAPGDAVAVSSVMGVFLVIIISIALGGTIWFMINKIRSAHPVNTNSLHVTFTLDHSTSPARVKVTKAPAGTWDWVNDLTVSGSCRSTLTLNGAAFPTSAGTKVNPGDILAGCANGQTLQIVSSATHGSELLFTATF